jgi:hypothetical protein
MVSGMLLARDAGLTTRWQCRNTAAQTTIVEAVGAGKAPIILNAFRGAVMGRKHEIEAGSGSLSKCWASLRHRCGKMEASARVNQQPVVHGPT